MVRYILPCSTNMTSLHGCNYCVAEQLGEAHAIRCQLVLRVVVFCVGGALIHGGHQLEMNMYMFAFQPGTPWLCGNGVILAYMMDRSIRFADSQPINA